MSLRFTEIKLTPVPSNNASLLWSARGDEQHKHNHNNEHADDLYRVTSAVNAQTTNYTTQLIAEMPGGTVVYSNTFTIPFSTESLQAAIMQAAQDLTNAGASSYSGPTPTKSVQSLQSVSSVTITNPIGTNVIITVTTYIGPTNIMVGNHQTNLVSLPPGGEDIDTLATSPM